MIPFTISVAFATLGYVFYLAISSSEKIQSSLSSDTQNNANHIFFQRLLGVLIFGILPALGLWFFTDVSFKNTGLSILIKGDTLLYTLLLAILIIPLNYFNSKKPDNLQQYPQIREKHWSFGLLFASALSWIVYLFAYEMLFRGFLLFTSLEILDYWPAIILNTGIYSLVHYPKGLKAAVGAIPLGLILCVLTIKTGNFWLAFFVHIILALSNEWFSLRASSSFANLHS